MYPQRDFTIEQLVENHAAREADADLPHKVIGRACPHGRGGGVGPWARSPTRNGRYFAQEHMANMGYLIRSEPC